MFFSCASACLKNKGGFMFTVNMNSILKVLLLFVTIIGIHGALNKPEGSPCDRDGVAGTCVHFRRCPTFAYDKENKIFPPICSFQGESPVICCTDCHILKSNESVRDPLDFDRWKTNRTYEKKCYEYQYLLPYKCKTHVTVDHHKTFDEEKKCYIYSIEARAPVGGEDALRGDFPHMALLGYGKDLESAQWLCGGSLISARYILTAAHCAAHVQYGPVKYVALGMLKRSDPPTFWKRYEVNRFIPHPLYRSPAKYDDIALIETKIFMNLSEGVRPACLSHQPSFPGDEVAFATGWGSLGPGKDNADVMQKVTLKRFSTAECSALYPRHRHLLAGLNDTTQVCYGDTEQVKDTCEGDSGGPLQQRNKNAKHCIYVIIGVTSTGRACGAPGVAGLYTRVYHYVPWIESIVWPPD